MDIAAVTIGLITAQWGFLAFYFAVGYFGHKASTYLENTQ